MEKTPTTSTTTTTSSSSKENGQEAIVFPVVDVEGVPQPSIFKTNRPLTEHVQMLKDLEMRHDDVIVLAYTKAGTHWFWEMAKMLTAGRAEYDKRAKENVMLEAKSIESIQAEASPRVLNSHLPFRLLPRQLLEKKVKVIHVYRNIKDVFVSMYFHYRQIPGAERLTLTSFENVFFSEEVPTGNYFTYLKQMEDTIKKTPDLPVFCTSFEDTKEDPVRAVKKLAEFLGVEASPQLCQDIAEATSFAKLKKADETKAQSHLPPTNYYRKGEVGDWKNHLTVAQSERFDAAMTQLTSYDFRFRYTL